jgi:hypothetical protein
VSNYSTGGLSESSNTDSDSESEVESEFDDGPVQKKRKADDSQRSKQNESPSIWHNEADLINSQAVLHPASK